MNRWSFSAYTVGRHRRVSGFHLHAGYLHREKLFMDCIIAVRSQTFASRGGRLLHKAGIPYSIVSIDPSLTRRGCAHGLRIPASRCNDAKALFDKNRFAYGDILGEV